MLKNCMFLKSSKKNNKKHKTVKITNENKV